MSYAIFRSESINTIKDLGQIGAHNKRDKKAYKSNPDIDISKTKNNIDIVPLSDKYTKGYYELVKDYKNEELQKENRKLHNFLNVMLQTLKKFFNKLLHIGTEKDKDDVVKEITAYYSLDYYNDRDLHDIADGTPREEEINDYIYEQNYGYDKD